eukprot:754966-Hanusia_phi.AAC.1
MEINLEILWDSKGGDDEASTDRNDFAPKNAAMAEGFLSRCWISSSSALRDVRGHRPQGLSKIRNAFKSMEINFGRAKHLKAALKDAVQVRGFDAAQAGKGISGSVYIGDRSSEGKRIAVKRKADMAVFCELFNSFVCTDHCVLVSPGSAGAVVSTHLKSNPGRHQGVQPCSFKTSR